MTTLHRRNAGPARGIARHEPAPPAGRPGHGKPATGRSSWLCVAYAFPPINRSGTHRTLSFVRHLDRLGWDATVLTVEPGGEPRDETLLERIPQSTSVLRTDWTDLIAVAKRALRRFRPHGRPEQPAHVETRSCGTAGVSGPSLGRWRSGRVSGGLIEFGSRLLMTPDSRLGWVPHACRAGLAAIRARRPKVIYSTSPYASAHLVALWLSTWTRIPWVADFRDPWCGNPFRTGKAGLNRAMPAGQAGLNRAMPGGEAGSDRAVPGVGFLSLDCWDAWLERRVLRRAAHVICNTDPAREYLCRRYPWVATKCSTIMNGIDPELFEDVEPLRDEPPENFVLTHCGQFYGRRSPGEWLAGLRRLQERDPQVARRVRFISVGATDYDGRPLAELARAEGVSGTFRALKPCGHRETLARMLGSDAVVLAGSAGRGADLQVPNKLFEYLAARRPVVATAAADSPVRAILGEAGADCVVCEPGDSAAVADAIHRLAKRSGPPESYDGSGVERFDRAHRVAELESVFRALATPVCRPPRYWRVETAVRPA